MSSYNLPATISLANSGQMSRAGAESVFPLSTPYPRPAPGLPYNHNPGPSHANGYNHNHTNGHSHGHGPNQPQSQGPFKSMTPQAWEHQARFSPTDSVDDIIASPSLSDYSLENGGTGRTPPGKGRLNSGKPRAQRRPSNRDEFDGPHQFLQRPPPEYIAMQERELPHLPTNLLVQEQDSVLSQVNDRLSQCAYDFVAKYQFPIPLTQDMRPVERPQDREWYASPSPLALTDKITNPPPAQDRVGLPPQAPRHQAPHPRARALQRPDQAVRHHPRELARDAPRRQAPEPSAQGRQEHFAARLGGTAGRQDLEGCSGDGLPRSVVCVDRAADSGAVGGVSGEVSVEW
jgi:hypothetical protein